jgi:chromate transporter
VDQGRTPDPSESEARAQSIAADSARERLWELARLFLKLGFTAFGGPAAYIALMEDELVRRRQWLSRDTFLDLLGASNLIPGPTATELVIHIGRRRGGLAGVVVSGSCFIVPAALTTVALAWCYVRFGALPEASGVLFAVKPVIIAVVFQALWRLGTAALKTKLIALVAALAVVAGLAGVNVLVILLASGVAMLVTRAAAIGLERGRAAWTASIVAMPGIAVSTAAAVVPFSLGALFLFFLKVGAVLYGSGYVLLAFLQADLVERLHWLSQAQLLDAVAVGQVTPGPVFSTATFIGYLLGGWRGATVSTIGIFLPAFFFVAISGPLIPRLRRSALAGAFLDGVNAGSLALMVVVTWQLGRSALVDPISVALGLASAVLLLRFSVNSVWLILAAGLAGLVAGYWPA